MTPRDLALGLMWSGTLLLAGLLLYRLRLGAWSLEDEEIPKSTQGQWVTAGLALSAAGLGLGLFVWSWFAHGVG
ncbi:hypothetical protein CU669_07235 [Paramagnetospirillum kuznetsovii]|uniref:Uncharacterized protein n=1 Tax=Paramagnetospirillum kuznetsovii TaxID=2053833 RepID=A0A364NZL1_9PROT|nr:hypothetical protein [Paramagnetospirillum kuznetsovii]RAU22483.1 hypothetical protein CU669_07235 [Paramagnetospirillum kuznetsovii]